MPRFATLAVALMAALTLAACQPPAAPTLDRQVQPIAHQFFDEVRGGSDLSPRPAPGPRAEEPHHRGTAGPVPRHDPQRAAS